MSTRLWAQNAVSSTRVGATPTDSLSSIGSINTNLPLANTKSLLSAYGRTYALSGRQVLLSLASSSLAIRYNRFSVYVCDFLFLRDFSKYTDCRNSLHGVFIRPFVYISVAVRWLVQLQQ